MIIQRDPCLFWYKYVCLIPRCLYVKPVQFIKEQEPMLGFIQYMNLNTGNSGLMIYHKAQLE